MALFGSVALVEDPTDLVQFLSHFGALIVVCAIGLTTLLLRRSALPSLQAWAVGPWVALVSGVVGAVLLSRPSEPVQTVGAVLLLAAVAGPPLGAAMLSYGFRMNAISFASPRPALTPEPPPRGHPAPVEPGEGGFRPGGAGIVGDIHPESESVVTDQVTQSGKRWAITGLTIAVIAIALASIVADRSVFALAIALGAAAAVGWLSVGHEAERFVCLLLAAGFFVTAGVEIFVVADDLIGSPWYRMNTVFKFYNQVWVLLALSGAALVALMVREAMRGAAARPGTIQPLPRRRSWARAGVALSLVAALASLAYPALATGPRLVLQFSPGTPSGSLDALGWMDAGVVPVVGDPEFAQIGFAGDAAAIDWLLANVEGTPVIAEASIGPYRCNGSRISAATGLPTIIGWERHQQQQRYPDDAARPRSGRAHAVHLGRYRGEDGHPAPVQRGVRRGGRARTAVPDREQ